MAFLINAAWANPGAEGIYTYAFGAYNEATATGATTTTSGTDGVMNSMTITPPAGTYIVIFSTWCSHSTNGATVTISIYNNGTQDTGSLVTILPRVTSSAGTPATFDLPVGIISVEVATGSDAIAIEWSTSSGTATCTNRTLDLVRLQ